jgi:hypothetical protein
MESGSNDTTAEENPCGRIPEKESTTSIPESSPTPNSAIRAKSPIIDVTDDEDWDALLIIGAPHPPFKE